jgi:cytochrome c-type biogenesis protein CcmH/NrfG
VADTSEAFQTLYNTLLDTIGPDLSAGYYTTGYAAYDTEDFAVAIENLSRAFYYDETNVDALYFLGQAYRRSGDNENAVIAYQKVVELFDGTERARKAQQYLDTLTAETNE